MACEDGYCVACGEKTGYDTDHHCNQKRLAKIDNSRKSHDELHGNREPTYRERLSMGFFLLELYGGD